jgi:tetratricopeptide (TPR) repeat protein
MTRRSPLSGIHNELSGRTGFSVQARDIHGPITIGHAVETSTPAPAQLPATSRFFTNRYPELDRLQALSATVVAGTASITAITGIGGVGKTAIALHWAHQVRDRYPDGQLYIDLRGYAGPTIEPVMPHVALPRLLRALGVAAAAVPTDLDEQAALYRSLTTDRKLIILLDNAADDAQVLPLLPGPGPGMVIVTTRQPTPGLITAGAHLIGLNVLDEAGSLELLANIAGEPVATQPDAAAQLAAVCERLPLRLCVLGADLATGRHTITGLLAAARHHPSTRKEPTDMADADVVLTVAYHGLAGDPNAQLMYRLLGGVYPGVDLSVASAAALADLELNTTARAVETLEAARLVEAAVAGGGQFRYSMHDKLREHATALCLATDPEPDRKAALYRVADRYLQIGTAAQKRANPNRWYLGEYFDQPPMTDFRTRASALGWMEDERDNIRALILATKDNGLPTLTHRLVEAHWSRYTAHRALADCIEDHALGYEAACADGDLLAQARMDEGRAFGHNSLGEHETALRFASRALRIEKANDHKIGEATARESIGIAHLALGDLAEAESMFARNVEIFTEIDRPRGAALNTRHLGEVAHATHNYTQAIGHYSTALDFWNQFEEEGYQQARTRNMLARTLLALDVVDEAADEVAIALTITKREDARNEQAICQVLLADIAARRGQHEHERSHLKAALDLFTRIGMNKDAEQVKARLDALEH